MSQYYLIFVCIPCYFPNLKKKTILKMWCFGDGAGAMRALPGFFYKCTSRGRVCFKKGSGNKNAIKKPHSLNL